MRVYELAKEFSLESKELIRKANEIGIPVKTHMAALEEHEQEELRAALRPAAEPEPEPESALPSVGGPALEPEPAPDAAEPAPAAEPADDLNGNRDPEEVARDRSRRQDRGRDERRPRSREAPLSQDDPYWQFGTPVESWGQSRGGRAPSDPYALPPDDPYWQFGSPPETWGSKRNKEQTPRAEGHRPRVYLECRSCGVKLERKAAHRDGKVPCPFCNRWMVLSK